MTMYDDKELELIICGLGEINADDWAANTEYRNCTADDDVVQWFWKAVRAMEPETRARLLQFVTGTSRVPVTGFQDLKVPPPNVGSPPQHALPIQPPLPPPTAPTYLWCMDVRGYTHTRPPASTVGSGRV